MKVQHLLLVFSMVIIGLLANKTYAQDIYIQTIMEEDSPEHAMLSEFAANVTTLTDGQVRFQILPKGAKVGTKGLLEAINSGEVDAGFAWTHYWSGHHPAAMLFGSPTAGAGLGLDNISWISWFMYGGGRELYDQLWSEMGMNIKGFILQPQGPEALGWFQDPIESMDDFRDYTYRAPPGIPGEAYIEIGVDAVTMSGADILPALESETIDAAEWCCPYSDSIFGFQKVLKNYYLQGLHQNIVNADLYINSDVWKSISPAHQRAIEISADASMMQTIAWRMFENGKALKNLTENHDVQLHDTPPDYFTEYMEASANLYEQFIASSPFFKKVYDSMETFAQSTVPFWAQAQTSNANIGTAYANSLEE